jgi:hypothetical protein
MAITQSTARQYRLVADFPLNFADFAGLSGVAQAAVKLPAGAVVHGGRVFTDTAYNSATSDTLSIGDAGSATRFVNANATVLRTAGVQAEFAAAGNGVKYVAGGTVLISWTGVGAVPTAGASRVYIEYSVDGKGHEVQT